MPLLANHPGPEEDRRRVVAKVEFSVGELFPRVGFIVTNLETDSRAVGTVLQQAGDGGTVDQGGQAGGEDDPAELPSLPLQGWSNMRGTTGCY